MQPFTTIDKATTKTITAETIDALAEYAASRGLVVTHKKGRYDPTAGFCDVTLSFALADADPGRVEWERYCAGYGLKPDDYGRSFVHEGKTFTVAGVRPRAPKRPISCTSEGRSYSFPLSIVKLYLGVAA